MLLDRSDHRIQEILHSYDAPAVVSILTSELEKERQRREQFYANVDEDMKAEFINGEVVIHSPVKKVHSDVTKWLTKVLDTFVDIFNLGFVGFEKVMVALTRNDFEPDVVFFKREKALLFTDETWKYPAPDFVVEVLSKSTEDNDRNLKFKDYAAHGVAEYWIIDPVKKTLEQYLLGENGEYELVLKAHKGTVESQAVAGFSIQIEALFDAQANMAELQRILAMGKASAN